MFFGNDADLRQDMDYGENINIDINNTNSSMNTNTNMNTFSNQDYSQGMTLGSVEGPIIEPGRERVVQRNIVHEVRHICPMNTKIINNHIFNHTYQPRYTCCEENTVTNVQCGSCCNFN